MALPVGYASAKVVLLGDSGVGKTALAYRLVGDAFTPTESTHARFVGTLPDETVEVDGARVRREVLLWDLAGQPGYRVLHPLHLGDAAVALILVDAASEADHSIEPWVDALRQAARLRNVDHETRTFLLGARVDRGVPARRRRELAVLTLELGLDGFFMVSAKTGEGIAEVRDAIHSAIPWHRLPVATTADAVALVIEELRLRRVRGDVFAEGFASAEGATAVAIAESRGVVRRMASDRILLQPELLDLYAGAMVVAARDEPSGLAVVSEDAVRQGRLPIASSDRCRDPADEQVLLAAVIDELLARELALRIDADGRRYLWFPSEARREQRELATTEPGENVFSFAGNLQRIHDALTIRLAFSGGAFALRELWRNAATFVASTGGICGTSLRQLEESRGELTLFHDRVATAETRYQFAARVRAHLEQHADAGSVLRRRIYACASCRQYVVPPEVVAARTSRGSSSVICPICEARISLVELPSPGRDFDVFLSYAWMDAKLVREIAMQLQARGIRTWLPEQNMRVGDSIPEQVEQALDRASTVAFCVGPETSAEWPRFGTYEHLVRTSDRGSQLLPVLLPGASEGSLPRALRFLRALDLRDTGVSGAQMDLLAASIRNANRPQRLESPGARVESPRSLAHTREDDREADDRRTVLTSLGVRARRNRRRIAMALARLLQASNPVAVEAPPLPSDSVWNVELPSIGLRLSRAALVVREQDDPELPVDLGTAALVLCVDLDDSLLSTPDRIPATVARLGSRELEALAELGKGQVTGWLGRLITQQVDIEPMLPYRTEGATTLFFGRDQELKRLIGEGRRGGVILGVHQSGKSSLLRELRKRIERSDRVVVGPITLDADNLEGFVEQTLEPLGLELEGATTPARWAERIRAFARSRSAPVFLLDEVDWLVRFDETGGHKLGSAMRALQQDQRADFYLAGHLSLRAAARKYGSPFRNFAEEVILTGLTRTAALRLIREPIQSIGFEISDPQADRVFRGTAGMAALIQEFCGRLLTALRGHHSNIISDDVIAQIEESPAYLDRVFHYFYDYDENVVSRALFLLVAVEAQVTRASIADALARRGLQIASDRIDASLTLLASFGILDQSAPGEYRIPGRYLQHSLAVRNLETMLAEQIEDLQHDGG